MSDTSSAEPAVPPPLPDPPAPTRRRQPVRSGSTGEEYPKSAVEGATEPSPVENSADADSASEPLPAGRSDETANRRRRRRGGRGGRHRGGQGSAGKARSPLDQSASEGAESSQEVPAGDGHPRIGDTRPAPPATDQGRKRRRRGKEKDRPDRSLAPVLADLGTAGVQMDPADKRQKAVGRYLMCVQVRPQATQIAVLEGRQLIEHSVSRPHDGANEIDGNIYLGKVQNVLPGMEAAFIDIGTPKNAVLYRGDVRFDAEDLEPSQEAKGREVRIEDLLKAGQRVICQVTKNPIAAKGARLTQEVSLPGRFCVLVPNSQTYGISKRLSDEERKRLRRILDQIRPEGHGVIVRTAAEGSTAQELEADLRRLKDTWDRIQALAAKASAPALLYQEPDIAVRVIREEFNRSYRSVVIDDRALWEEVSSYVAAISPDLAGRVEYYDTADNQLPLFERYHVHEQLHKALDRKVWLPSGGSLIIERTEALTVIDVNTGKNVGSSNLEETVYRNNLEAAEEIARQLRLRDIGGIIVIDFIDMEIRSNRDDVVATLREALARDKTRTQVFDISELGLVEMTRKRISEGLVESLSRTCPACEGRGIVLDDTLI